MADGPESGAAVLERMRAANGHDFGPRRRDEAGSWIEQQRAWKDACYVGDWSFLADAVVSGPDALPLLSALCVNTLADFAVGRAKHLIQCSPAGKVVAEGVGLRRDEDRVELHGVPAYRTAYAAEAGGHDVAVDWRDTFNFQVQGPASIAVLDSVCGPSLRDVEFVHFAPVEVAGAEVTAVRMGMSGEVGFELQGPAEAADEVWAAVLEAGEDHGIVELTARTSSSNHLEACFPTRGRDYVPAIFDDDHAGYREWLRETATRDLLTYPVEGSDDGDTIADYYRSPVELGWGANVALDHAFVGREALESELDAPARTIVTLVWDDAAVVDAHASLFSDGPAAKVMAMPHQRHRAMVADAVRVDGETVGVSTCRGYSVTYRAMLSLGVVDVDRAEPGTEVTVVWGEGGDPASPAVERHAPREIPATVAPAPYKPDNRRVDLHSLPRDGT